MADEDLKLNLGAGSKRIPGFLNVDYSPECSPDLVMNLEVTPWAFKTDSVSHVIMSHVLEHIGQTPESFIAIMTELYRICRHDAVIDIIVPHHAHDNFYSDPTHVRAVTLMTLALFDKENNLQWRAIGVPNSPLALQSGVNFKIVKSQNMVAEETLEDLRRLKEKDPFLHDMFVKYGRNIISSVYLQVRVVKEDAV